MKSRVILPVLLVLSLLVTLIPATTLGDTEIAPTFLLKWGGYGTSDGLFQDPQGVAVDSSGNVYVADTHNHRIQKFTGNGVFITKWGSSGSSDGQFDRPYPVAADASGNIYVGDATNRVQKFTNTGVFITKWGSSGSSDGQFNGVTGIAVDASNNVYVTDTFNNRVQKFDDTGTFITKWGNSGSGDGQFQWPQCVTVDSAGNVYVSEYSNHRIQKFTGSGVFICKWGSYGSGDGQFNIPVGLTVDSSDYLYVADYGNNRIQKFSNTGLFVTKWGVTGSGDGQFNNPIGVAIGTTGDVYVVDKNNYRIQVFNQVLANIPPLALNDSYATSKDTILEVIPPGVLANDTDANNDPLTAILADNPAHGNVTLNINGSFSYLPDTDYVGIDSFTYAANDGETDSNIATVTITITLETGLAAFYPFNGNANDESGNGWNGLVHDASLTTDRFGNGDSAYHFDGVNDYIETSFSGILGGNPRTISLWAKSTVNQIGWAVTYGGYSGGTGNTFRCGLNFYPNIGTPGVNIDISNGARVFDANVNDNSWHLYTWVVPDIPNPGLADVLIYQDGQLLTTLVYDDSYNKPINTGSTQPVWIGHYFDGYPFFSGDIDDIHIYDYALSESQIQELYDITPANNPPLAIDDAYEIDIDTNLNESAPGVLANDTDADNDPLTAVMMDPPSNGMVVLNSDGSFTYTPNPGYVGDDFFTYIANDGDADSNSGTVFIVVQPSFQIVNYYLHGLSPNLLLTTIAPEGTTTRYKDSPPINRTLYKEIGTWNLEPAAEPWTLAEITQLDIWLGLKNSDDQGTFFDVKVEILKNGEIINSGEIKDITGITRNPSYAKQVTILLESMQETTFEAGDVFSIIIWVKVADAGGHNNAVGVRLYYDTTNRPSGFSAVVE